MLGGLLPPVKSFLVPTLLFWSSPDKPHLPCAAAPLPKAVLFTSKSCYVKVIYASLKDASSSSSPSSPLSWTLSHPHPSFHTHPLSHPQGLKSSTASKLAFTYPPKSKPTFHEITVHYFPCQSLTSWSCWHSEDKTPGHYFSMLCVRAEPLFPTEHQTSALNWMWIIPRGTFLGRSSQEKLGVLQTKSLFRLHNMPLAWKALILHTGK